MSLQIKKLEVTSTGGEERSHQDILNEPISSTSLNKSLFASELYEARIKIDELVDHQNSLRSEYDDYKEEVRQEFSKQSTKNIEVVGIFSAIVALLIIDTSIIKSVDSFLAAILLIVGMTASLAIFIVLVHHFFNPENPKIGKSFWIPISVLCVLILIGIFTYAWKNRFSININDSSYKNVPVTN